MSRFYCTIRVSAGDLTIENILASSANRRIFTESSKIEGKSFINIVNKRGPRREPRGTPELAVKPFEL